MDSRPPPDYEDPDELEAIREAKERSGDFKLKSAHDYVVPEHSRMNASKVTDHIAALRQAVCIFALYGNSVFLRRVQSINQDMMRQCLQTIISLSYSGLGSGIYYLGLEGHCLGLGLGLEDYCLYYYYYYYYYYY